MGAAGDRDRKLMAGGQEFRLSRRFGDLKNNVTKGLIRRREACSALDLNLQDSAAASVVVSVDDDVVERMALRTPLELDASDCGAGQSAWLTTDEHRK